MYLKQLAMSFMWKVWKNEKVLAIDILVSLKNFLDRPMTSQTSYNSGVSYPNIDSAEIIENNLGRVYYNNTS